MYNYDDLPNSEIEHLIDEWIRKERDRRIIKRRLLDGVTFERIADEFYSEYGLSVRQIKNIVYRSEKKIFCHVK